MKSVEDYYQEYLATETHTNPRGAYISGFKAMFNVLIHAFISGDDEGAEAHLRKLAEELAIELPTD